MSDTNDDRRPPDSPVPPVPPPPAYGEYAEPATPGQATPGPDAPSAPPAPQYAAPAQPPPASAPPAPAGRRRRTWDLVLTVVLLVLGLGGMLIGILYGALLPVIMEQAFVQQGLGAFTADSAARTAGVVIVVSHLALYVIAVVLSVLMLVKRRIAFWIPLTAGVVAAVIFWVSLFVAILSDPQLMSTFPTLP